MSKKKFIQCDQSGAEALIVSYLCRAGKFRDLFTFGIKPHSYTAMVVFKDKWESKLHDIPGGLGEADSVDRYINTPISELKSLNGWNGFAELIQSSDDWPSEERYYFIGKMITHASNYGMRESAFQMHVLEESEGTIVLTKREAEKYLSDYHSLFPEIHEWHRETERIVRSAKVLYNLQGYPRQITELVTDTSLKELYAFVPQSTVGCITNIAYTQMQEYIEYNFKDWDMMMNGHDSYTAQCKEEEVNECAKIMHHYITPELISPKGEHFKMKSEVQVGYNLAPYNEKKNPLGLRKYTIV